MVHLFAVFSIALVSTTWGWERNVGNSWRETIRENWGMSQIDRSEKFSEIDPKSQINLLFSGTFLDRRPREIWTSFHKKPNKVIQISPTPSLSNPWVAEQEGVVAQRFHDKDWALGITESAEDLPCCGERDARRDGISIPAQGGEGVNQSADGFWIFLAFLLGGYRARSHFGEILWEQCNTGQSWVTERSQDWLSILYWHLDHLQWGTVGSDDEALAKTK